jgi:hypothetical protein
VHGEAPASSSQAAAIRQEFGAEVLIPRPGEEFELA